MKQKIIFDVTIGSKWVDGYTYPQGGTPESITIEYDSIKSFDYLEAAQKLAEVLRDKDYHIWYWYWVE